MNITTNNFDAFSSEKLLTLANEFIGKREYLEAQQYLRILIDRNPLDLYSRFHYAYLLRHETTSIHLQAMTKSKNALLKILTDFPQITHKPSDFNVFFIALAETLYEVGLMKDARLMYSFIAEHLTNPNHLYQYAEVLASENIADPNVTQLLQKAINTDSGKTFIKKELELFINSQNLKLNPEKIKEIATAGFKFSNSWFLGNIPSWERTIVIENPRKILEIVSYEGQSICYLIEKLANDDPLELHSVDTWEGGIEHRTANIDMIEVEKNFDYNIKLASKNKKNLKIYKHKGFSSDLMPKMMSLGMKKYFDFIYIDGSHETPDVLSDAVMAFHLIKVGGILCFDDYLPQVNSDPFATPKLAIDAFTNLYMKRIELIQDWYTNNYQLFVRKISN